MEPEKHGDDDKEGSLDEQSDSSYDEGDSNRLFVIYQAHDILDEERNFNGKRKYESQYDIEKEEHEKFTVAESHAICDPGTVVVHIQYASLTSRAVVTSKLHLSYRSGLKL